MDIRNIKHRGLKVFIEKNQTRGLPSERIRRITQIVGFILDMEEIDEFLELEKWHAHTLSGDRLGTYSLMVSRNWRITFLYDSDENEIYDLDLEDYH
jgi:proteic killer suppression protein